MEKAETIIEVTPRSGLRGRIDRLVQEYTLKAQALRIAVQILDEDDRRQALETAPKKFLQAINHRNGNGNGVVVGRTFAKKSKADRMAEVRDYLAEHPRASTNEIAQGIGVSPNTALKFAKVVAKPSGKDGKLLLWVVKNGADQAAPLKRKDRKKMPINGDRLSLFLLEHLETNEARPAQYFFDALEKAKSPFPKRQAFNGPMSAALVKRGYAKAGAGGFKRTSKGTARMVALRVALEKSGTIRPGGYGV